jgi:hypothetical protein
MQLVKMMSFVHKITNVKDFGVPKPLSKIARNTGLGIINVLSKLHIQIAAGIMTIVWRMRHV